MYGDPEVLRRRVDQLREQADDVRALADQLVARTESIGWRGRAADSMRLRVTERATHLRGAATEHETAADTLDRHLQLVEQQQEAIAAIEHRATQLTADAVTRIARVEQARSAAEPGEPVVRSEPDPDDVTLAAFEPPPAGHRDWLSVELPGLEGLG